MKDKKENIDVTCVGTQYILKYGDDPKFSISVVVDEDGDLSIFRYGGFEDKGFVFAKSYPGTVKAIGELLIAASELE